MLLTVTVSYKLNINFLNVLQIVEILILILFTLIFTHVVSPQDCKIQWDASDTMRDYDSVYRVKFNRLLNKKTFKIRSTQ